VNWKKSYCDLLEVGDAGVEWVVSSEQAVESFEKGADVLDVLGVEGIGRKVAAKMNVAEMYSKKRMKKKNYLLHLHILRR